MPAQSLMIEPVTERVTAPTPVSPEAQRVAASIDALHAWLKKADWQGYDTFDGLSSPLAPLLTFNNHYLRIVWQQAVRRFPLNLRPLLGIRPSKGSKAMGFFAQGYLTLHEVYDRQEYVDHARSCLKWLIDHPSPGYAGYSWGNHFSYESRGGTIPKGVPTIVWTSLIGQALLDGHARLKDPAYLDVARGIAEFYAKDIPRTRFPASLCFAYTPGRWSDRSKVHNASMLAAAFLARYAAASGDASLLPDATQAVQFTVDHQHEDGSWIYAEGGKWDWVDSFHTGYVLESLHTFVKYTGDRRFQAALEKGYRYYIDTFFAADGTPHYYNNKMRPLDIQCASQGIQTLVNLRELDSRSVTTATKVALWTIDNMQDKSGYFYYRKYPLLVNRTPTLHWGQATMLAALALLLAQMRPVSRPVA